MARVAREVSDARVLKLIRRFLEAGMMQRRVGRAAYGGHAARRAALAAAVQYPADGSGPGTGRRVTRLLPLRGRLQHLCGQSSGGRARDAWGQGLPRGGLAPAHQRCKRARWRGRGRRKFLGFSFTVQRETRLRVAPESVRRLTERIRELLRNGRGRSLSHTIENLNPLLRGWIGYFQLSQSKGMLEDLDGWVRRRLRCLLWRQWKRPRTRQRKLRALGLDAERAWLSAVNGHGPWWNAGASHLNLTLPATYFTRLGLVSLLREQQRLQCAR